MRELIAKFVREEIRELLTFSDRKRPFLFVLVASIAMASPLFIGVLIGRLPLGVIGCLGGFSVLYMRRTTLALRTRNMLVSAATLAVCFGVGILCSSDPALSAISLGASTLLVIVVVRRYRVLPPGSFFFILVACIARAMPYESSMLTERMGAFVGGSGLSVAIGFLYSVLRPNRSGERIEEDTLKTPWPEAWGLSLIVSIVIGGGYYFAEAVGMESPYWVPISSIAILQGLSLRHIWQRMLHRVGGTFLGLGVAWMLLAAQLGPWGTATAVLVLSFLIESLVTRNYALAVVFVTPLTLVFAEINALEAPVEELMRARFVDTLVGSVLGLLGGVAIYGLDAWRRSAGNEGAR